MKNKYLSERPTIEQYNGSELNLRSFTNWALIFLAFISGSCFCWSCQWRSTEAGDSFEKSDQLIESIRTFEVQRTKSQGGLQFAYEKIDSILENYEVDNARHLTLEFEGVWMDVLERIEDLKQRFKAVCARSNAYFKILEEETALLNDEGKRAQESRKNSQLRQRWEAELQQATSTFSQIDDLLRNGDDLFRLMLINSLRATLSEEIGEIQNITIQADQLLLDLRQLSQEGLEMLPQA